MERLIGSPEERVSLPGFARHIWRCRELLWELVRRELGEAYAGSVLARVWAVLHPILLLGVYLFVFGYVFTNRIGAATASAAAPDFAVFMLSGLITWLTMQAALAKATNALTGAANLVKQVVFPIELLPVRAVLASQLPLLIGLALLVIYSAVRFGVVSPLLPLVAYVVAMQLMLLTGIALFLAALTVFVRDTRDLVQFFLSFGMFLSPAIYLPGVLPGWFEALLYANPLSYSIWCLQDVFYFRSFAHWIAWPALGVLGIVGLYGGLFFFQRTRGNFGDVL